MEAVLASKQIEASLLLFYYMFRYPALLLLLSLWWIDLGRVLQNIWRFVIPAWVLVLALYNVLGMLAINQGQLVNEWSISFGVIPIFEFYGTSLAVWAVLNYLSVGPTQFFAFLTQLEMHTMLAWRARKSEKLGAWVDKEFLHARERRAFLAESVPLPSKVQLWLTDGNTVPYAHYRSSKSKSSKEIIRKIQENQKKFYSPPPSSSSQNVPSPEQQHDNGRVVWTEKGKQYHSNPKALNNIIGMQNVLQEIQQAIIMPLKHADELRKNNVPIKTGILLYGPPGNGKTALVRSVAESLGLYFISVSGSDLQGTLVGATEQNIHHLFEEAKRHRPSVIFLDEIDSIGGKRGATSSPYQGPILNQLLTELDGFEKLDGVFYIAATNRLDILDPALIRAGRFGTKIYVPNPSPDDIIAMWTAWTRRSGYRVKFGPELDDTQHLIPELFKDENGNLIASGAMVSGVAERLRTRQACDKHWECTMNDLFYEVEMVLGRPIDPKVVDMFRRHVGPNEIKSNY